MSDTQSAKKLLGAFYLSEKLNENSALVNNPVISAELLLNSEILYVRKMRINELIPQLLIIAKDLWTKNLAIIAEIKFGENNIVKMLIANDKLLSIQFGSLLGDKALEIFETLRLDIVDVSLFSIDTNKMSSALLSIVKEEVKSAKEVAVPIKEINEKTTKDILQIPIQPVQQVKSSQDITDFLRPIYDDVYLLVRKYALNLVAAPEIKLENDEVYIQIRIAPIKGLFASRTKKKIIDELKMMIQDKKGLSARILLEEIMEVK